jgi:arylformamidase
MRQAQEAMLSMTPDPTVWRSFTRAALDAAYDNSAAVAESATKLAEWLDRSMRLRARYRHYLDLAYGERPRNRIDLFPCGKPNAPLLVFIHGGYWQRNAKEVFSCMAEGPLAHGIDVALPGYTLAPEATLTQIVAEIRAAVQWLRRSGPRYGIGKRKLIVSGWSAGGHLAALAMDMPEVDAGLAISGIFDLEPCRLSYLNEKLRLTPAEVRGLSPILQLPPAAGPLLVTFGTAELPELQRQSRDYWRVWSDGRAGALIPLDGLDHFTILEELARRDGRIAAALHALCEQLRASR